MLSPVGSALKFVSIPSAFSNKIFNKQDIICKYIMHVKGRNFESLLNNGCIYSNGEYPRDNMHKLEPSLYKSKREQISRKKI